MAWNRTEMERRKKHEINSETQTWIIIIYHSTKNNHKVNKAFHWTPMWAQIFFKIGSTKWNYIFFFVASAEREHGLWDDFINYSWSLKTKPFNSWIKHRIVEFDWNCDLLKIHWLVCILYCELGFKGMISNFDIKYQINFWLGEKKSRFNNENEIFQTTKAVIAATVFIATNFASLN